MDLNQTLNNMISELVNILRTREPHGGFPTSVSINRDERGNVRVSYKVMQFIAIDRS